MIGKRLKNLAISLIVILLSRLAVRFEIQKLGAVQSDPRRPLLATRPRLGRELDVPHDRDGNTVLGFAGQFALRLKTPLLTVKASFRVAVLDQRLFIRIDDHDTVAAINDDGLSSGDIFQKLTDPDHCRDLQRTGQNRGVAGVATDLGGESKHKFAVEIRGLTRRQVVGQHENGGREMRQFLSTLSQQQPQQTLFQVVDIDRSLGQVLTAKVLQSLGILSKNLTRRILGRLMLLDPVFDLRDQLYVSRHHQMGREDGRVLVTEPLASQLLIVLDLLTDRIHHGPEPSQLHFDSAGRNNSLRDAKRLGPQQHGRANRHTGRNCDSASGQHLDQVARTGCSNISKSDSINVTNCSIAPPASSPSASTSNSIPASAPSVSRCSRLFASTRFVPRIT